MFSRRDKWPVPLNIKNFLEAFYGRKINKFTIHDVKVEPETPYGDLKEVDVAEQTLTLKPGPIWSGIDPAKGPDMTVYQNVCVWWDGTLRPGRGHSGNCKWRFDGQFHIHLKNGYIGKLEGVVINDNGKLTFPTTDGVHTLRTAPPVVKRGTLK